MDGNSERTLTLVRCVFLCVYCGLGQQIPDRQKLRFVILGYWMLVCVFVVYLKY